MIKSIRLAIALSAGSVACMMIGINLQNLWGVFLWILGIILAVMTRLQYDDIMKHLDWTRSYVIFEARKGRAVDDGLRICLGEDTLSEWIEQANKELEAAKLVVARGEQRLGNM